MKRGVSHSGSKLDSMTDAQSLILGKLNSLAQRMNRSFEEDFGKTLQEGPVMPRPGRRTGDPVVTDHPTN